MILDFIIFLKKNKIYVLTQFILKKIIKKNLYLYFFLLQIKNFVYNLNLKQNLKKKKILITNIKLINNKYLQKINVFTYYNFYQLHLRFFFKFFYYLVKFFTSKYLINSFFFKKNIKLYTYFPSSLNIFKLKFKNLKNKNIQFILRNYKSIYNFNKNFLKKI